MEEEKEKEGFDMRHMYTFPKEYIFTQRVWFDYSKFCNNLKTYI